MGVLLRPLSILAAVTVALVFLVPSTVAVYTAVNGTAWDMQCDQDVPLLKLLAPAATLFATVPPEARLLFSALQPEVTHPLAWPVPLFELDCALIC